MHGDDGDPIQPWLISRARRVQRWRSGFVSHHACRHVTLGTLPDGRWWVEHTETGVGARAYPTERRARQIAAQMIATGEWREVPAEFDSDGQPTTGGWTRRGGNWYRT